MKFVIGSSELFTAVQSPNSITGTLFEVALGLNTYVTMSKLLSCLSACRIIEEFKIDYGLS